MSAMQNLKIRIGKGDYQTAIIPDISLELEPQFPREWFASNPDQKPPIFLPTSDLSDVELGKRVNGVWSDSSSLDEMLEFVSRFVYKNFRATLSSDWKSYGLEIGLRQSEITPLSLFDVREVSYEPTTKAGLEMDDKSSVTKFCEIMSLYRLQYASQVEGRYSDQVIKRMERVFKEQPFGVKDLDTANMLINSSFGSNDTYRKLVAGIDMFFNKFRDHKYSKIKVTTLSSRNKDCGGLSAIRDLSKYLACPTSEALKYVMDSRAGPEIMRLITEGAEITKNDSYFHYFREMGLSQKSPYSSSVNPALYNFIYSLGTFMGISRSFNARLFSEDGINNSVNLAAFVAYYAKNWVSTALVLEEESILRANDELEDAEEGVEEKHDHLYIYNKIMEVSGNIPPLIRKELREQLVKFPSMRDGTIGKYIKDSF